MDILLWCFLGNSYNTEDNKDKSIPTILMDSIMNAYASSLQFYSRLNRSFLDALFVPFTDALDELREIKKEEAKKEGKVYPDNLNDYLEYQLKYYQKYEKVIISGMRGKFDINLREEGFTRALSEYIDCYSDIAKITGFGQIYQSTSNFTSYWNNEFVEPIRDTVLRTPSHKIYSENKYSLFHYDILGQETQAEKEEKRKKQKAMTGYDNSTEISLTPILIIYDFINRHYILDLVPDSSIVRNLQSQGFDIFATDWGTPSSYDKKLTIGHYVNNYL